MSVAEGVERAERAVLGTILLDSKAHDEAASLGLVLTISHFPLTG